MLGRHHWLLDLFAHFRLQYAVAFLVLATVLALQRQALPALVSVLGGLVGILPLLGHIDLPRQADAADAADAARLRLVSYNTWFRAHDHARLVQYLEQVAADVVVLQEMSAAQAERLHASLASYPYAYTEPGIAGAVIFSRWPLREAATIRLTAQGAPAARVVLDWRGTPVTLLGVHLHWPLGAASARLRNEELLALAAFAKTTPGPVLVAGDFNVTPWSGHFQDLIRHSGLNDCAVRLFARSWPAQFPPLGIAIDHCLASRHWRSLETMSGPRLGSDHLPLVVDLALPEH